MELKRCNNCANGAWICEESAPPEVCIYCDFLSDGSPSEWKPKVATNADRIRAMTDEELAEFFSFAGLCSFIQTKDAPFCEARGACDNCLVEWLQQPAEGDA